jgi:hypothetical protein
MYVDLRTHSWWRTPIKVERGKTCSNIFAAIRTQLRRRIVVLSFAEANRHDLVGDC